MQNIFRKQTKQKKSKKQFNKMSVTRNGESERANILKANRERIVKTISPERIFFAHLLLAPSLFSCGIVKCTKFEKKKSHYWREAKKKKNKVLH